MKNAGRILTVAAVVVSGAWLPAAWACLNDTRTNAAEAEFRSRYEAPPPPGRTLGPTVLGVDPWGATATVVGAGAIAGGIVLAARRRGR